MLTSFDIIKKYDPYQTPIRRCCAEELFMMKNNTKERFFIIRKSLGHG